MKINLNFFLPSVLLIFCAHHLQAQQPAVTISSLLSEMTNNAAAAYYPSPVYRSLESSSYNRKSVAPSKPGWFADNDGTGFIKKDTINGKIEYVIMEDKGPGCITRMWTPYFYYSLSNHTGPDIRIYLDGSKKPVIKENFIKLLTGRSFFPRPFADLTTRAGVCYFPIPYSKSCKVTLDQKPFYYCIAYRSYRPGTSVKSFSMADYAANSQLTEKTGRELQNPSGPTYSHLLTKAEIIQADDSAAIPLSYGSSAIQTLTFKVDTPIATGTLRNVLLKIAFDGNTTVWCPLGDFFCSAGRINNFRTRYTAAKDGNTLSSFWPMPYKNNARITLVNYSSQPIGISVKVGSIPWKWTNRSMYFHTRWANYGYLPGNKFFDLNFISARGTGVVVGDALTVLSPSRGWWGEGDEKIYIGKKDIKDSFPSQFGTGTEDYYGWAGGVVPTGRDTFSLPFCSNVRVGNQDDPRGYNICQRVRILDNIPFENELRFDMEASPGVDIRHFYNLLAYSMVTYWYGMADASSLHQPQLKDVRQKLLNLSTLDVLQQQLKAGHIHIDSNYILSKVRGE
jgi:hypothetical protein